MADEETTEQPETDEVVETPAIETEAEEYAESEADTAETEAEIESEAAPPPARPEPAPVLTPKERRRRRRAGRAPATRGPQSAQERQAERDELRAKNARARRGERAKARAAKPAATAEATAPVEHSAGTPKARQGIVVSDKAAKTITVRVDTSRRHRRYKKIVRSSKMLHAHDERNEAHEGDLVRVVETRPLSATKRWRLVEILERAE